MRVCLAGFTFRDRDVRSVYMKMKNRQASMEEKNRVSSSQTNSQNERESPRKRNPMRVLISTTLPLSKTFAYR